MKKFIALLLSLAMFLSLAGCGNSESTNIPADSTSEESSSGIQVGDGYVLGESATTQESISEINTNPVRSELYHYEGAHIADVSYQYDSKGNLVQRDLVWTDEYGGTTETMKYEYDAHGNVVAQHQSYSYGDYVDSKTYTYTDGKLTQSTEYGNTIDYIYNDKNQLVEKNTYWDDGTLSNKTVYTYDSNGNRTKQEDYYGDGELNMTYLWTYNADGTVAEQVEDYGKYGTASYKYYYNDDKQLKKTESYTDGQHMYSLACSYDKYGRLEVEGTVVWDWKFNGYYKHFYE
ncbi:MAG: hypothetical protein IKV52_04325 [Oscillospiraceae bacterium]|nr:hypothetical protein [Oscillospiraceae bacterium]